MGGLNGSAKRIKLEVHNLEKTYEVQEVGGRTLCTEALKDVNFKINEGEFVAIIGPSGCGKSTLLKMVAGLFKPTSGQIVVEGKEVHGPGLDRGVVFQEGALFPWMTVADNIRFGARNKKMPPHQLEKRTREVIKLVQLEGFENAFPARLSGGMKQRVAVARALAYEPEVLLMDEPFGQVDAQTRGKLQQMLMDVWRRTNSTIMFVTHSIQEAVFLADRIIIFSARPGTVKEEITIDLPRPRLTLSDEFSKYRTRIAKLLGGEEEGFFG